MGVRETIDATPIARDYPLQGDARAIARLALSAGGRPMSYRAKLALLTAAIFVGLSLAIVNLVTKAQFLLSMPSE